MIVSSCVCVYVSAYTRNKVGGKEKARKSVEFPSPTISLIVNSRDQVSADWEKNVNRNGCLVIFCEFTTNAFYNVELFKVRWRRH